MRKVNLWAVIAIIMAGMVLVSISIAGAGTVCVDPSDSACYNTIQEGINTAVSGDTVEVASGTYVEQITLKDGITVQGENRETTIIWNNNNTVIIPSGSWNTYLKGFTITSANGNGINAEQAHVTIEDNIIKDCGGNGIYHYMSGFGPTVVQPWVINNIIKNNTRGIYYKTNRDRSISGVIWNNTIIKNLTEGIYLRGESAKIFSVVTNNVVFGNGGDGIKCVDTYASRNSNPYISNNIIMSNGNYGINNTEMTPSVAFNDVFNNSSGNYNGVTIGPGSISVDPEFVNEVGEDFHLMGISPCVDFGSATNAPPDDIDGDSRPQNGIFDIGVDEYVEEVCMDNDGDGYSPDGGDCGPIDCDDDDEFTYPGAPEICDDNKDNDCDDEIDECGSISGYIMDDNHAPINNAKVNLRNKDDLFIQTFTDASGYYKFEELVDGWYWVIGRKKGYNWERMTGRINLNVSSVFADEFINLNLTPKE